MNIAEPELRDPDYPGGSVFPGQRLALYDPAEDLPRWDRHEEPPAVYIAGFPPPHSQI
jgi:hypothetical protein